MANDLNRSIKLYIDGSEATNKIDLVKESISRLEDKLKSLTGREADYAKRSQDLKKELDAKNRTLQNYEKQLAETERVLKNLSGATYNELLAVQSRVRKELRNAVPGTKQYTAALEQNRRVTEALSRAQAAMRVEVGAQGNVWSRASGFINKYIGLIGTVIAAITGVSMKLNQLREQRNKREEAKADVEALTGLSKDDINWLEQQAVQLSTTMTESGIRIRQSATEILDAYKLVGSAKPELLDNKEALAEVTKQTLILASASGMTLKDAVDAVTLSLNQYGDGAEQASRYANVMAAGSKYGAAAVESVTTAVTKSGVAAASAEIPIEQLVGTIETLAEKGIKDEIAGTGLKKFFLTLQTGADDTNPKIVGLEKALDNLQKKQLSAAQIKKQFGEEGYNVASVLINEADKVKYYTQVVTGTSVAMEQAATKSETAAAKLSQAKNRMQELGIELLEKLNPALISAANGAVSWTGKLIKLLNFINENKRAITLLTIALIAYTAAKNSDVIISKVVTFWNNNIAKSLKAIKKELMTNPYGIIAVVAATAIAYLINLKKKNDELKDSVSGIKKVNEETNKSFIQQESKIRALTAVINDNGIALDVRRKALNDLKEIIPDYNAQLTDEGTLTKNNTDAIKDYLVQLEKQIKLKAAQQELENLYAQKRTLEKDEETQSDQYWKIRQTNTLQGYNRNSLTAKISRLFGTEKEGKALETLNETRKNLSSISEKIDEITKEIGESALAIEEVNKANEETTNNKITTPIIDEEKAKALLKKRLEEEAKLYSQHQSELKEAYLKRQDETLQTEQQFNDRMETLELEHQQRIINIAGAKSKEGIDAQNRINDIKIKQQKEQMNRQLAEEKTLYENQQKDLKRLYVSGKDENLKTEKEYNEAMEHLTIMHLERVLKIANLDADQRRTIEQQLLDFKVKCLQDEEKERKKLEDAAQKKKDELARKEKQRLTEQAQQYRQYGEQIGDTLGQMISGQENALQNFADTMLDILFDVLSQMIDIEIAKATGVAVGAVARSAAEAYAMPDSVATFGATGAARAAVLSGLIMGALAAAKSTLKGLIKGGSSSATDNNTDSTKTAQVQVKQWASGRYDVIGEDDGRTYRGVPYIGDSPTGIVRRTSLISESGAELIINAEDLSRLQHHINYPIVVQAIQDARSGRLPQRAEGNYDPIRNSTSRISQTTSSPTDKEANLAQLIKELHALIEKLKYLKAYVVLRELNEAQELADKSKEPFTRKKQ
ncbi:MULTISPECIES: phage tail tape measure protein [Bacteroides]|jgi:TP901 family phage tail tape measure protein|uniref:Phage tail tape measure protein n=1 Tax=Bacteroides fragilis TaxID=817 RepID=A0A413JX54_BACFG|nr:MULTISPECIES: phage tail tape measure protein [Bacteroides]MBU3043259.1 phage tail tape measure protein [Bacteroides sp. HF-4919]MBY2893599.1 phage tail length tape measure protein [Bacteroides fragilis]MCM0223809.1 phage tail tape measure protein [Bacteroides fragilis]MCM0300966.1 phage tail tape measure protein [Bacteroides fragilis]MCM0361265.1 phage tail tape measure protein [Bacteroides fragilis]